MSFLKLSFSIVRKISKFYVYPKCVFHQSKNRHTGDDYTNCNKTIKDGILPIPLFALSFAKIYEFVGLNEDKEVKELIHKAKTLLQDGNTTEAAKVYNTALKNAILIGDEDDIHMIKEQLAVIAFFEKQYDEAESLFSEVKTYLTKKGPNADSLKLSYITLRLAETYENLNNFSKAEQLYNACLDSVKSKIADALEKKDVDTLELWLMSLYTVGHYYSRRSNFDLAQQYFKRAYEICLQYKGEINEFTVTLLQQLGAICFQKGDLEDAVEYLKLAVDSGKHLPGMQNLADVYVTLGNIYLQQGLTKEAQTLCMQGYKNAKRHKYETGVKEAEECLKEFKGVVFS